MKAKEEFRSIHIFLSVDLHRMLTARVEKY
jgi:hypothetical protein